jgi:hypothetical protein
MRRIPFFFFALATLAGCVHQQPSYLASGDTRMDIEGTYAARITQAINSCNPSAAPYLSDVEVYYLPKSDYFRILINEQPYDAHMTGGGKFVTKTATTTPKSGVEKRYLRGEFKDGRLSARLSMTKASIRGCDEITTIEGTRR